MGLAASQGRFLCLTARNSDLVYEGQQISQQRLALAQQAQEVATRYNEAMSNTEMKVLLPNAQGELESAPLTYSSLTLPVQNLGGGGLGLRVVDQAGYIVIPGEFVDVTTKEGDEDVQTTRYTSVNDFVAGCMPGLDESVIAGFGDSLTAAVEYYYSSNDIDKTGVEETTLQNTTHTITWDKSMNRNETAVKTLTDPHCTDAEYIKDMLETAQWTLQKYGKVGKDKWEWSGYMWQGSTDISSVSKTDDDAKAESEYEAAMKELNWKDKVLELRLEQVETQQEAVNKEIESVKKIIDKNIEDTYKTFSG